MAIVSFTATRSGNTLNLLAVSDQAAAVFYWYLDGAFQQSTPTGLLALTLAAGEQVRVTVLDRDASFDPIAGGPEAHPARRTLAWVRSLAADAAAYRVEQKAGVGSWEVVATVVATVALWEYRLVTERLNDLTDYQWRVIPIDRYGNEGTAVTLAAERVVRYPDAPDFGVVYDDGTQQVTVSAA